MKKIIYPILVLFAFINFNCKKEAIKNNEFKTPSNVSPNAKEYISFEVEGLSGLTSFVFQDVDGYTFKGYHDRCPIAPTYVLHEVKKTIDPDNNPKFSIFMGTASQPSKFKDGVKVKKYEVKTLNDGNAMIGFCHNSVNDGGLCSSTMNNNSENAFEVVKIETIDGIEYAFGTFKIYAHTPAPNNNIYYWLKNGKFKIKI